MFNRCVFGALALAALAMPAGGARAWDDAKYPDWKGAWDRFNVPGLVGQPAHDQTKPWGFGQQAPLTPQYRKVLEESIADQVKGGLGNFPTSWCQPAGMPHMMMAWRPLEFVVTPATTYILIGGDDHYRRIFTDGRDWPKDVDPTYQGYSIGKWIDEDGDGRYDVLEVETRGPFKGPRAFDATGLPLAFDNELVFKERIYSRQGRSQHPSRRNHHDRPCADAALDRRQAIRARRGLRSRTGPSSIATRTTRRSSSAPNITS